LSNLVDHAEKELKKAGLFDADSDYDGMLGDAVLELIRTFAAQGHSGFSAQMTRELFYKLSNFEEL
jgi:hypothetical protein